MSSEVRLRASKEEKTNQRSENSKRANDGTVRLSHVVSGRQLKTENSRKDMITCLSGMIYVRSNIQALEEPFVDESLLSGVAEVKRFFNQCPLRVR